MPDRRLYSPVPSRFRTLSHQLFKEYSMMVKNWSPEKAGKMVERRIKEVEQDYYLYMALHAIIQNPETRLNLIRGENPLAKPNRPEEKTKGVRLVDVLHSSALGAAFSHTIGQAEHMFYYSAAAGMYLPGRQYIQTQWKSTLERKRYPLFYRVKTLLVHAKEGRRPLTAAQMKENSLHLKRQGQRIRTEFENLSVTLRMLDALKELVHQPRTTSEEEQKRHWANRMMEHAIGGRTWHLLEQEKTAAPEHTSDMQKIVDGWRSRTVRFADIPPEPGRENEWLQMQEKLRQDRAEYQKAMEVAIDLNEL